MYTYVIYIKYNTYTYIQYKKFEKVINCLFVEKTIHVDRVPLLRILAGEKSI